MSLRLNSTMSHVPLKQSFHFFSLFPNLMVLPHDYLKAQMDVEMLESM